jgi:hypothetical protein
MKHYNIGKKIEINPFDGVKFVKLVTYSTGNDKLRVFLDKVSNSVETRRIDGEWTILYNIEHLDFTTIVDWFEATRGKFQLKNTFIHFRLEDDLMVCW